MNQSDIIIIGAGAAGLMAGRGLVKSGKKITILEARNYCGGRIHTLHHEMFFRKAELGAEFIHGNLPVTLGLLNEAGIEYYHAEGEMRRYKDGKFENGASFMEGWDELMQKLHALERDISIAEFLRKEFSDDKYKSLRDSVCRFISGYDSADPEKASSFALRDEWTSDDESAQYRIKGGYGKMIGYLEDECKKAGAEIMLNSVVKEIRWKPGNVEVITADGANYRAAQVLIALPLGVLQADESKQAAITFDPPIPGYNHAFKQMGYGAVIKVLLEFDEVFWEDKQTTALAGKSLKNMAFLLSDEEIPTWWTQIPHHVPVLTGWLGGPPAALKKDTPDTEILQQALQSLSNVFKRDADELKKRLVSFHVMNWTNDPFALGSYVYDTVEMPELKKIVEQPIENSLFFTGEYLYDGPAMGTVEAALTSGEIIVKKILNLS